MKALILRIILCIFAFKWKRYANIVSKLCSPYKEANGEEDCRGNGIYLCNTGKTTHVPRPVVINQDYPKSDIRHDDEEPPTIEQGVSTTSWTAPRHMAVVSKFSSRLLSVLHYAVPCGLRNTSLSFNLHTMLSLKWTGSSLCACTISLTEPKRWHGWIPLVEEPSVPSVSMCVL